MKIVVITGSTKGIGLGLAKAFLARDCQVVISSRHQPAIDRAIASLGPHAAERVLGFPCDVTQPEQVQALWDQAITRFGQVDIWINNAGMSHAQMPLWEQAPAHLQQVLETNVLGSMYGARVALRGMLQQGYGAVYNMEGLGSDGRQVPGLAPYATSKYAIRYLTKALVQEAKGTPVIVGALSPGMVVTDLLTGQSRAQDADWERAKRIFNILADRVETVTPWLARKALANTRSGARIRWLTSTKAAWRFLTAPFNRRDLFADD